MSYQLQHSSDSQSGISQTVNICIPGVLYPRLLIFVSQEWGSASPEFCGGYRLEFDQSWTALADCDRKTNELMMIDRILDTDAQVSFSFLPSQYQAGIAIEQQKQ